MESTRRAGIEIDRCENALNWSTPLVQGNDARADREIQILKQIHRRLVAHGAQCFLKKQGGVRTVAGKSSLEGVWRRTRFTVRVDLDATMAFDFQSSSADGAEPEDASELRDAALEAFSLISV